MSQNRKIRVLIVAFNDLGIGGIQTLILTVTRQLKDEISTDAVVFTDKPAYFDEEFQTYGRIFRCPHYEGNSIFKRKIDYYIRYFRIKNNIYKIIKENGPYDVVHSHTFFEAAPCMAAAKKAGVPIRIAHSHNTAVKTEKITPRYLIQEIYRRIYRRIIVKNATNLIGCSQAAVDYLFGKGIGKPIYNSINVEKFSPSLYPSEEHTELRLIHVGNFVQQKNHLFLLDIFKAILAKRHDVHLTLIGRKDSYFELVLKKIKDEGLEKHITILPNDSNVAEAMSKVDFFVFPSLFEGFGNVMIEAQAMGLKCFASTAVPEDTNCGLAKYIPLEAGADVWADAILKESSVGTEKHPADISRFTEKHFAEQFWRIYRGE